jgi:hypothetical protein
MIMSQVLCVGFFLCHMVHSSFATVCLSSNFADIRWRGGVIGHGSHLLSGSPNHIIMTYLALSGSVL